MTVLRAGEDDSDAQQQVVALVVVVGITLAAEGGRAGRYRSCCLGRAETRGVTVCGMWLGEMSGLS